MRTVDPYSLYLMGGQWYVVGRDHDRDDVRTFRLDRIRGDVRFATRRERDFRVPPEFDPSAYRDRAPWQLGESDEVAIDPRRARGRLAGRARCRAARHGRAPRRPLAALHDARTPTRSCSRSWLIGLDGQASPLSPPELVERVATALERVAADHEGDRAAACRADRARRPRPRRPSAASRPVAPERFAVLQAMLADLLAACGERKDAMIDAAELAGALRAHRRGARGAPPAAQPRQLRRRLLRRLRRAGRRRHDPRREGAVRRRVPPPGAALAARGQGAAAGARPGRPAGRGRRRHHARRRARARSRRRSAATPCARRRRRSRAARRGRALCAVGGRAQPRRLVEIEYLARSRPTTVEQRVVEPHYLRGVRGDWYCDTYDRTRDGERTFRVDRIRAAERARRDVRAPRERDRARRRRARRSRRHGLGVVLARASRAGSSRTRPDTVRLADGAALATISYGSERWLATELCSYRGDAILLEPEPLRAGRGRAGARARGARARARHHQRAVTAARAG